MKDVKGEGTAYRTVRSTTPSGETRETYEAVDRAIAANMAVPPLPEYPKVDFPRSTHFPAGLPFGEATLVPAGRDRVYVRCESGHSLRYPTAESGYEFSLSVTFERGEDDEWGPAVNSSCSRWITGRGYQEIPRTHRAAVLAACVASIRRMLAANPLALVEAGVARAERDYWTARSEALAARETYLVEHEGARLAWVELGNERLVATEARVRNG